jgi:chromosome segregation ATPase
MKQEIDLHKQAADERREELVALRSSTENHQQQQQSAEEMERRVQDKEQKFAKMKTIYENLREEHIKALTEIRELRSSADDSEAALRAKSDEVCQITTELQTKSVMLEAEVEELKEGIEALNRDHAEERERVAVEADAQLKECQTSALRGVCAAASDILEQSQEDLQNATSVSYPARMSRVRCVMQPHHITATILQIWRLMPCESLWSKRRTSFWN